MDQDPIPFGLTEKNREIVQTLFRYLDEQKIIGRVPDIDPLFANSAADFIDT